MATVVAAPVTVIAEIGTAHGGDWDKAKTLIRAAADSGADAVKFQWVYAREILHPKTGFVSLPTGNIPLYDRFRALEVPPDFFAAAAAYARECGVSFICSPFGTRSLDELLALRSVVAAVKIASPELNHTPLLEHLARNGAGVPVILSSGVSTLADIEQALTILRRADKAGEASSPLTLLHCVTAYPAPEAEYNVRLVQTLRAVFGVDTGISDHSLDPLLVPVLATVCGATMIEKHITLSRQTTGLDDPVALEPEQFAAMVDAVRNAEVRTRRATASVEDAAVELLGATHCRELIQTVLGTGVKTLAPSEAANYRRTNRSLHYTRDLRAGDRITADAVAVLRTEKQLTPGIEPMHLPLLLGTTLARAVQDGDGVVWDDVLYRDASDESD